MSGLRIRMEDTIQSSLLALRGVVVFVESVLPCFVMLHTRVLPRAQTKTLDLPFFTLARLLFLSGGLSVTSSAGSTWGMCTGSSPLTCGRLHE